MQIPPDQHGVPYQSAPPPGYSPYTASAPPQQFVGQQQNPQFGGAPQAAANFPSAPAAGAQQYSHNYGATTTQPALLDGAAALSSDDVYLQKTKGRATFSTGVALGFLVVVMLASLLYASTGVALGSVLFVAIEIFGLIVIKQEAYGGVLAVVLCNIIGLLARVMQLIFVSMGIAAALNIGAEEICRRNPTLCADLDSPSDILLVLKVALSVEAVCGGVVIIVLLVATIFLYKYLKALSKRRAAAAGYATKGTDHHNTYNPSAV